MTPFATIDAKIAEFERKLDDLRRCRATLAEVMGDVPATEPPGFTITARHPAPVATPAEAPPGKPEPRPRAAGRGKPPSPIDVIAQITAALAAGPLRLKAIIPKVVASQPTVSRAIRSRPDLFRHTDGEQSPWELTPEGRVAAATA